MRLMIVSVIAVFPFAAQTAGEKEVLAACQKVFDGMAANDSTKILSAMTPEARLYGVRDSGAPYAIPADQWAARLASLKSAFIERFTKAPTVSIHEPIANVWGEYELLRDGKFAHCGVDSFNLVKTAAGWRVAAVFDTEESTVPPRTKGPA